MTGLLGIIFFVCIVFMVIYTITKNNTIEDINSYYSKELNLPEFKTQEYKIETITEEKPSVAPLEYTLPDKKIKPYLNKKRSKSNTKKSSTKTDNVEPTQIQIVDIESYDTSCEPSVSYRQSCASPVESYSSSSYSSDSSSSSSCDSGGSSSCGGGGD